MIDKFFFSLFGAMDHVFEWIHKNFNLIKNVNVLSVLVKVKNERY